MKDKITRQDAAAIGREVELALGAVAARWGLSVKVRGGSYDAGSFRPKVEFKTATADASEFALYAAGYGLLAEDFGATFTSQGRTFAISGVAPRSHVRPILADEVGSDKRYKFPAETVRRALGRSL